MVDPGFSSTRRSLLSAFAAAGTVPWSALARNASGAASSYEEQEHSPVLRRTREGRLLSRFRYHNAEGFFRGSAAQLPHLIPLYNVGIVLQLGLSSHLLDVGFDDDWCARHIGLHVNKSLRYANATGLDANSPDLATLVAVLSPYHHWRNADVRASDYRCPFSYDEIRRLTRGLLDRVRQTTGHSRPRGWSGELL